MVPGKGTATLYTLTNSQGNTVKISNYGGTITSISIGGKEMVIGFDDLDGYVQSQPYYGALIGRYGNRIANARFSLGGKAFDLVANEKGNQLHGGPEGFDKELWEAAILTDDTEVTLILTHTSPDGHMGFPGEVTATCSYAWTNDDELRLEYEARSTKDTIINLTNHSYFNIGGEATIEGLILELKADRYTPIDKNSIPTGELAPVTGTPFDFTTPKPIGKDIAADHPQIQRANGYDHNWVVNGYNGKLKEIALVSDPISGRKLRCFTTEPGVQVFTANFQPGDFTARGGKPLPKHGAICLETQHFPDSPNQENFATPRLNAGDTYRTTTVYRFE